ncbi:hypothetical protein CDAR_446301 [Caerostris darwini]|uniref:Uncharacterized protein n=1 Tax=Caerostris darwini TaxID=1538125 RepID=A0AAV4UW16_9ARAC|nr:hypothetical protein CDAR_446301 [Caerostris darwini]
MHKLRLHHYEKEPGRKDSSPYPSSFLYFIPSFPPILLLVLFLVFFWIYPDMAIPIFREVLFPKLDGVAVVKRKKKGHRVFRDRSACVVTNAELVCQQNHCIAVHLKLTCAHLLLCERRRLAKRSIL